MCNKGIRIGGTGYIFESFKKYNAYFLTVQFRIYFKMSK